jgi:hypothetical protein
MAGASSHVSRLVSTLVVAVCIAARSDALEIRFDYRYDDRGFFDAAIRRAALELAAAEYTSRLRDRMASLPEGRFVAVFPHPSDAEFVMRPDLEIPVDTLVIFVGARPLASQLAIGAPGQTRLSCFAWLGAQGCFDAMRGRGEVGPIRDWILANLFRGIDRARAYPASDFATWGGSLSFDSDAPWHFGGDDVPPERYDFLSSAIHELGHVMGVGTAESWGTHTRDGSFSGERVVALRGAAVALERDGAHWKRETRAAPDRDLRDAAFGPDLAPGVRKRLTELDIAALADIGWRIDEGDPRPVLYGPRLMKGDVNGDGSVDRRDADLVRAYAASEADAVASVTAADLAPLGGASELSGDGVVDEEDITLLERLVEIAEIAAANEGRIHPYHLQSQLLVRARRLSPEDPFWIVRAGGWLLVSDPRNPQPGALGRVRPALGDVDGDGVLTRADVEIARHEIARQRLADPDAYDAADIAPMVRGDAIGDGRIDRSDVALFELAIEASDVDGDGLSTSDENLLNELVWMPFVGRPRYEPLTRWTEACLDFGALGSLRLIAGEIGGPTMEFCSRDGTPWSRAASLSPEQIERLHLENAATPEPSDTGTDGAAGEIRSVPPLQTSVGSAPPAREIAVPTESRAPTASAGERVPARHRVVGASHAVESARPESPSADVSPDPHISVSPPQPAGAAAEATPIAETASPPALSWVRGFVSVLLDGLRWLLESLARWLS